MSASNERNEAMAKSGPVESSTGSSVTPKGLGIVFQVAAEKTNAKAEMVPEAMESGWAHQKLVFGNNDIFRGAVVTVSSAWGEGRSGSDLWGWTGGAADHCSEVRQDPDGSYFFIYSIRHPAGESAWISAQFRFQLRSGAHGVGNATFPFPG